METGARSEESGVQEFHDAPQVADVVFDRRAGQGNAVPGRQGAGRLGLLGLGILDVLGFVEDHSGPIHLLEDLRIAMQQGVTGDHHAVEFGFRLERGAALPSGSVVD